MPFGALTGVAAGVLEEWEIAIGEEIDLENS